MSIFEKLSDELLLEIFARVQYTPSNFRAIVLTNRRFNRIVRTESLAKRTAWLQFQPLMMLTASARSSINIDWNYLSNMVPIISSQQLWIEFLKPFTTAHHDVLTTGIVLADFLVTCRTTFYWTTQHKKERRYDAVGLSRVLRSALPPAAIILIRFITNLMYRALFLLPTCSDEEREFVESCTAINDIWRMNDFFSFCKFEGKFLKNPGIPYKAGPEVWRTHKRLYHLGGQSIHQYFLRDTEQKLHRSGRLVLLTIHQALVSMADSGHFLRFPEAERTNLEGAVMNGGRIAAEESLMHNINGQIRGLLEDQDTAFALLGTLDLVEIGRQIQEIYKNVSTIPESMITLDVGKEVDLWGLREWPRRVHIEALSTLK